MVEIQSYDNEAELHLNDNNDNIVDSKIEQFLDKLPMIKDKEDYLESLRQKFVDDFGIQVLKSMTKEQYVVGLTNKNAFCYRLETELQNLGNIHGATSAKFGLYYGKSGEDTEEKYRITKRYGTDPDEAMKKISKEIIDLIIAGGNGDDDFILKKSSLSSMFKGKILSVYYPEKYLCIFTDEHVEYFLLSLDIDFDSEDDIISKQMKLIEWKNSREEFQDLNMHIFSDFLYDSFGRPLERSRQEKSLQDERDKNYPTKYVTKINLKVSDWENLLQNPEVFRESDIELLKRFYISDNHVAACYDLGIQDGISPTSYIKPVVSLAKRVASSTNLPSIYANDGSEVWWRILFWGSYREDGHFEWKVRPRLAKAMEKVFSDLNISQGVIIEEKADNALVDELRPASLSKAKLDFQYKEKKKKKTVPTFVSGHKIYPRDRQTAINALSHAHYCCEINENHPTFIRKNSDKNYTEPHHLVPMAYSDIFGVSLDVEENIVSLCSNCHNHIHYGKDAEILITKLYNERKGALKKVGIEISLGKLLEMYNIHDNDDSNIA